jgi:hypothetical protein
MRRAWRPRGELHEILTGLDISALLVDHTSWWEDGERKKRIKDLNDYLQLHGWERTTGAQAARGVGGTRPAGRRQARRARAAVVSVARLVFVHALSVREDFTRTIDKEIEDDDDGDRSATCTTTCAAFASPP